MAETCTTSTRTISMRWRASPPRAGSGARDLSCAITPLDASRSASNRGPLIIVRRSVISALPQSAWLRVWQSESAEVKEQASSFSCNSAATLSGSGRPTARRARTSMPVTSGSTIESGCPMR